MVSPHPDAAGEREAPLVLLLNHHRDPLGDLVDRLRLDGYEVAEAASLIDTQRLLDSCKPAVALLNPLILKHDGVEFELLTRLQSAPAPVPVILMVESLRELQRARALEVPFRDFVVKPVSIEECRQRIEIAIHTRRSFAALQQRAHELEGQVSADFKTGLLSERYFKQLLQIEFKRAQRHRMPLSLLLIDVDDFKRVNDTTEYAFGDEVLRFVARTLKGNIRETDFAARFGGDEFVVLLPQTTPAEAVATAVRIRQRVAAGHTEDRRYSTRVTVSIGIDTYDGLIDSSPAELRRRANLALQEAKRRGKDHVWLHPAGSSAARGASARDADAAADDDDDAGGGGFDVGEPR